MRTKRLALGACAVALCWAAALPIAAETPDTQMLPPPATQQPATAEHFLEALGPRTIADGELADFTTVSSQFADLELPEGMYPGELTVNLAGQVVVESGGMLNISTLSIGGSEARPVVTGILSDEPLIVVKAGGTLSLTCVDLDLSGEGLLILQEPGSSVALIDTPLADGLAQWAPPIVANGQQAPDDVWLEDGTALTEARLPATLHTCVQSRGNEVWQDVALRWDLGGYDGRTSGDLEIRGDFLDETGATLMCFRPLALTVHWYTPDELPIVDSSWVGENACTASLTLLSLPEDARVWGEVSLDGGKTWSVWDEFSALSGADEEDVCATCVFSVPDNTPRHFRVVAMDEWEPRYWATEPVLMPTDDSDDQSGNRGGSTTPAPPDREPEPAPTPESPAQPEPPAQPDPPAQPESTAQPENPAPEALAVSRQDATAPGAAAAPPESSPEQPEPEALPNPEEPASTVAERVGSEPDRPAGPDAGEAAAAVPLPRAGQIALVAGCIGACALVGFAAVQAGPFRRKQP